MKHLETVDENIFMFIVIICIPNSLKHVKITVNKDKMHKNVNIHVFSLSLAVSYENVDIMK